jgi:hypothetical protein
MAVDFSSLLYGPAVSTFGRKVVVTPIASRPGKPPYTARGIFETDPVDVMGQDGSIYSDQRTQLSVRDVDFAVVPEQFDRIYIPADTSGGPDLGNWEVADVDVNGRGKSILQLRKIVG